MHAIETGFPFAARKALEPNKQGSLLFHQPQFGPCLRILVVVMSSGAGGVAEQQGKKEGSATGKEVAVE